MIYVLLVERVVRSRAEKRIECGAAQEPGSMADQQPPVHVLPVVPSCSTNTCSHALPTHTPLPSTPTTTPSCADRQLPVQPEDPGPPGCLHVQRHSGGWLRGACMPTCLHAEALHALGQVLSACAVHRVLP